jgi:ankyrin repeat protein
VMRLPLDRGADVNAKDNGEVATLQSAALEGRKAMVWLLLDLGADVNAKDNDGWTVLHWAALRQD